MTESRVTEVLPEPGVLHLWVTFDNGLTHRVDLEQLTRLSRFQMLTLRRAFDRVRVSQDGTRLEWPGGAWIGAGEVLGAGAVSEHSGGALPVLPVARLPQDERYRPLLPYLKHLNMGIYLRPGPIQPSSVKTLLRLNESELAIALQQLRAPEEQVLGRLCDLGAMLTEYFAGDDLARLLRRPWRYGLERCPGQPLLSTMLGCLMYGRPDLIERPCMLMITGQALA